MGEPAPCSLCWWRPEPGTLGQVAVITTEENRQETEETQKPEANSSARLEGTEAIVHIGGLTQARLRDLRSQGKKVEESQ